jgi:chromosome segregation ATPase
MITVQTKEDEAWEEEQKEKKRKGKQKEGDGDEIQGGFDDENERRNECIVFEPKDELARLTYMKMEVDLEISDLTAKKEDVDLQLQNLNTVKDEVEFKLVNLMAVKDDVESELVALKRKHDDLDVELQGSDNKRIRLTDDHCARILFACEICGKIPICVRYVCEYQIYLPIVNCPVK